MTDKMTRNESAKRHQGSIIERVAKRVSSDLSADIAREDTLPGNGTAEAAPMPTGGIRRPAAPVEEETLCEPLRDPGSADVPLVSAPGPEPRPESRPESKPGPETPGGSRPATGPDTTTATRADLAGARFNFNLPRLAAAGYITPGAARSRIVEEYRLIKRALFNHHRNGTSPRSNLISITSALPDEGKTFTAINLAISMATEENMSVLLIDADFNKPGAIAVLGCHETIGLIDVLDSPDVDLADVMVKTSIPNLTLVPAGQANGHSTELLTGARMARLAEEIAYRYENRFILFDCPPLLATTEAAALTAHVGQVLFVVRAETTNEASVRHALALIDEKPEVGLVLNRTRSRIGSPEFGDYYYPADAKYGYGNRRRG